MQRLPDECAAISACKLASQTSVRSRARNAAALRLAIEVGGQDIVHPALHPGTEFFAYEARAIARKVTP